MPLLHPIPALSDNYIWALHDGRQAWVVDPGQAEPVLGWLAAQRLQLAGILLTHHHGDHTGGVAALRAATAAPVWGPAHEPLPEGVQRVCAGDSLALLGATFEVIEVPGHTAGHIAWYCAGFAPAAPTTAPDPASERGQPLAACRTWGVESENRPQRAQFAPDSPPHSPAMGPEDGEKWAAAVDLQPTIPKSDRLLGPEGLLFCGDTLFSIGCGRLFEGTAAQMLASLDRLAALPEPTLVCCTHEYTLSNLRFARALEPDHRGLADYQRWCVQQRQAGRPTLPSRIGRERALNPFLRSREPALRQALHQLAPTLVSAGAAASTKAPVASRVRPTPGAAAAAEGAAAAALWAIDVHAFAALRRCKDGFS